MKLAQYFNQASSAAKSEDGEKLSRLLRYADSHASSVADELGGVNVADAFLKTRSPDAFVDTLVVSTVHRTRKLRDYLEPKSRRYGKKWSRAI